MDRVRDHLLAGARLARDEHRGARGADAPDLFDDGLDRGAFAEHAGERTRRLLDQEVALHPQALAREHALHRQFQHVDVHGPLQVVLGAQLQRLHRGVDRALRGHHDRGNQAPAFGHALEQPDAVEHRHAQVREHQVDRLALDHLQGLLAVDRRESTVPELAQHDLEDANHVGLVVDDQHVDGVHDPDSILRGSRNSKFPQRKRHLQDSGSPRLDDRR